MAKGQTYDEDFKKTIAPLYLNKKTYFQIIRLYDISSSVLYKWVTLFSRIINLIEILINFLLIDPFLFIFLNHYIINYIIILALWICYYFFTAILWTGWRGLNPQIFNLIVNQLVNTLVFY